MDIASGCSLCLGVRPSLIPLRFIGPVSLKGKMTCYSPNRHKMTATTPKEETSKPYTADYAMHLDEDETSPHQRQAADLAPMQKETRKGQDRQPEDPDLTSASPPPCRPLRPSVSLIDSVGPPLPLTGVASCPAATSGASTFPPPPSSQPESPKNPSSAGPLPADHRHPPGFPPRARPRTPMRPPLRRLPRLPERASTHSLALPPLPPPPTPSSPAAASFDSTL